MYCDDRLHATAWTSETDEDKKTRALFDATRKLSLLEYIGQRATTTQRLPWPRRYAERFPGEIIVPGDEDYYEVDEIPELLKEVTIDLAVEILAAGNVDIFAVDNLAGVIRKKTDVLETQWASPHSRPRGWQRYPRILEKLAPLLKATGGLDMVRC